MSDAERLSHLTPRLFLVSVTVDGVSVLKAFQCVPHLQPAASAQPKVAQLMITQPPVPQLRPLLGQPLTQTFKLSSGLCLIVETTLRNSDSILRWFV